MMTIETGSAAGATDRISCTRSSMATREVGRGQTGDRLAFVVGDRDVDALRRRDGGDGRRTRACREASARASCRCHFMVPPLIPDPGTARLGMPVAPLPQITCSGRFITVYSWHSAGIRIRRFKFSKRDLQRRSRPCVKLVRRIAARSRRRVPRRGGRRRPGADRHPLHQGRRRSGRGCAGRDRHADEPRAATAARRRDRFGRRTPLHRADGRHVHGQDHARRASRPSTAKASSSCRTRRCRSTSR